MNIILTRYLYFLDECLYSLLFAFINKNQSTFKEVSFWIGEIFYSGFENELWEYLWKIYYDFYAIKYPKYEKKINILSKKMKCSEDDKFENIMYVANLLYYSNINYNVFVSRMINIRFPNYIYKKTDIDYIQNMNISMSKNEIFFIRSLHDKKMQNIMFYIDKIDVNRCYILVKTYFEKNYNYNFKTKELESINYKNKKHIIIAFIYHMWIDESEIQNKCIFKRPNIKIISHEKKFNKKEITPLFQTLNHKRLYKISPFVGAFSLSRYKQDFYKDILRLYWDYFVYECPLWKKRIDKYHGKRVKNKYELYFQNDDEFDGFYEEFNYEPDEQSKSVQDMSICEINKNDGISWLSNILQNDKYMWARSKDFKNNY
jgi:hypothetical protein